MAELAGHGPSVYASEGQLTNLGLGSYPTSIPSPGPWQGDKERTARVEEGIDPRMPVATMPTFAEAVDAVIASRSEGWKNPKTAKRWRAVAWTPTPCQPWGDDLINEVCHWRRDARPQPDMAWPSLRRAGRCANILAWCLSGHVGQGHRPTTLLARLSLKSLPKQTKRVDPLQGAAVLGVGRAIRQVRETDAWLGTKLCL